MRVRRLWSIALAAALGLAACSSGGSGGSGATVSDPGADSALVAAGLVAADLPASTAVPYEAGAATALRACVGRTPRATAPAQLVTEQFRVSSDIDVFARESDARGALAWYDDSRHIANCIAEHRRPLLVALFAESGLDTSALSFGPTMMIRHPSPGIGDRSVSIRITVPIRQPGRRDSLDHTDVVVARRGRVVVLLVADRSIGGETWDTRFAIEALTRTIVSRLPV